MFNAINILVQYEHEMIEPNKRDLEQELKHLFSCSASGRWLGIANSEIGVTFIQAESIGHGFRILATVPREIYLPAEQTRIAQALRNRYPGWNFSVEIAPSNPREEEEETEEQDEAP